jgi:UDP-glucose 4-epimerase
LRILLTGSSGWLGQTLAPRLHALGHVVVGLDPAQSEHTTIVGSIADRETVRAALKDHRVEAIIHSGALHKPDVARRLRGDFLAVNVAGTFNLLEEGVARGIERFVFTSTTSLMISRSLPAGEGAVWMTEAMKPEPRNIYGVTKLAAEHLCRLYHELFALPVVILRTARFFPEADDMAHAISQSDANAKANELLFRRLTVEDAAEAHVAALDKAPEIGFDTFIVSAPPPFSRDDCAELAVDAPAVVARYFPEYSALYAKRGWTMFQALDRVYDPSRATAKLGFTCRTSFADVLRDLERG